MKNNIIKSILLLALTFSFGSCNDFLDVEPQDKVLEEKVFQSQAGIYSVVNGVYLNLTSNSLYGRNLTIDTDMFAQLYTVSNNHVKKTFVDYNNGSDNNKAFAEDIWTKSYSTILSINRFLESINNYPNVISSEKANILKGEMFAIRAMLHFDMYRFFGKNPVTSKEQPAIPYYDKVVINSTGSPVLKGSEVLQKILLDLDQALVLLEKDPAINTGTISKSGVNGDAFFGERRIRFNYYAALALKARVALYDGNTQLAYATAKLLSNNGKKWFPWTSANAVIGLGVDSDRIFSTEAIFSLNNQNLYKNQEAIFSSDLVVDNIYAPSDELLKDIYENNENDYRLLSSWKVPQSGSYSFKTFYKYADTQNRNNTEITQRRFLQPLIKWSEICLILAETATDNTEKLAYLNELRYNRGLVNLTDATNIDAEIAKEYRKEFIGEGQLFFYYKRLNKANIISSYNIKNRIPMSDGNYSFDLPLSQTSNN